MNELIVIANKIKKISNTVDGTKSEIDSAIKYIQYSQEDGKDVDIDHVLNILESAMESLESLKVQ